MWIVICAALTLLILFSHHIHNTWICPFIVLCAPYVIIIAINELVGVRAGFFSISDNTLFVLMLGLFAFFIGTIAIYALRKTNVGLYMEEDRSYLLDNYETDLMLKYSLMVQLIGLMKLARLFLSYGLSGVAREGVLVSGIFGHLILSIFPLQPFLLLYWINNKKEKKYLLSVLLTGALLFASFVKYHIICFIVMCYLFLVITVRSFLKKGTVALVSFTGAFFFLNYLIDFFSQHVLHQVSQSFYLQHLWKYIAGAVINGETFLSGGMGGDASIGYKILTYICAVPNMFISLFSNKLLFPYVDCSLAAVSNIGEESNVVDAITYMYPISDSGLQVVCFILYHLAFGGIMELLFVQSIIKTDKLHIFLATVFSFFLFFSFFGTFYINSMPWEICIYSIVVVLMFDKKGKMRLKHLD